MPLQNKHAQLQPFCLKASVNMNLKGQYVAFLQASAFHNSSNHNFWVLKLHK